MIYLIFQATLSKKYLDISVNYDNFINKDFRSRPQPKRHPHLRWTLLAAGCAVLGVVLASTNTNTEQDSALPDIDEAVQATLELDNPISTTESFKLNLPETQSQKAAGDKEQNNAFTEERDWKELKVKRGDSLSILFDKAKIKPDQLIELMQLGKDTRALTKIHPGDVIKVITNNEGQLQALHYAFDSIQYLRVIRQQDELSAKTLKHAIEKRTAYSSAEIESSLFLASKKAGLSQNLTMELANIFGWDIDFALDIRAGDKFTVIYEEIFKNGEKLKDGNILAAEFINQGKTYRALRYSNPVTNTTGYYSPDGHSLRKAFLRSPVKFSRISSRFTTRRYHPLLHKFRSHKGVDYAASRGTPVRASGDGKVIFRGRKGGYGNAIVIKHGSRYSTLYAHLSKFNRKARSGSRVKQGQIIGYVGSTGLASGPHLHYEFRVNGVHRNPLTVKLPSTKPIPKRYRGNFELSTQAYVAQLDVLSRSTLALNEN